MKLVFFIVGIVGLLLLGFFMLSPSSSLDREAIPPQGVDTDGDGSSLDTADTDRMPEAVSEVSGVPVRLMTKVTDRVTKKPFGILIDPKTSPVQPERFRGYHTGIDLETFPDEALIDVPFFALCDGTIREKRQATGYGGIMVTDCMLNEQKVTVLYGHVRLASIREEIGDSVRKGNMLGVLGTGGSTETGGERKHLHLGIHLGSVINILGYVDSRDKLSSWLDPYPFIENLNF